MDGRLQQPAGYAPLTVLYNPPMAEGSYFVRPTVASAAALLGGDDDTCREADRITWGPAAYGTSFRALWTPAGLYLRYDASDRDPWNTMEKRDDQIWDEEVVEIQRLPYRRADAIHR